MTELPKEDEEEGGGEGGNEGFDLDVQERGIEVVENEEDLKRRSGEEELGGYERKNPKIHKMKPSADKSGFARFVAFPLDK